MQSSGFYSLGSSVRIPATDAFLVDSGNNAPTGTLPDPPATAVAGTGPPVRRFMYDHAATYWRVKSDFDIDSTGDRNDSIERGSWDAVEWMAGSAQRMHLLEAMKGENADLRTLADELGSPRTTLQRNLSMLTERGWIEDTPSGYTTSVPGCLLVDAFSKLLETVDRIDDLAPFLENVDEFEDLDIGRILEPTVTSPRPSRPYLPMSRLVTLFTNAQNVRGFFPVHPTILVRECTAVADTEALDVEVILADRTMETLEERTRADGVSAITDCPGIELLIYDGHIPYALILIDDRVILVAYDEVGRIQATVESKSETTIEWATSVYTIYREYAREQ